MSERTSLQRLGELGRVLSGWYSEFEGTVSRARYGRARHELDVFRRAAKLYAESTMPTKARPRCGSCGFHISWPPYGHHRPCLAEEVVKLLEKSANSNDD